MDARSGKPIAAQVRIFPTGYRFACDNAGRFSIPDLTAGEYRVEVSAAGYETLTTSFRAEAAGIQFLFKPPSPAPRRSCGAARAGVRTHRSPCHVPSAIRPANHRNCDARARQRGSYVRRHSSGPFQRVPVAAGLLGHKALEKVAHIERYVRVGVLLNYQRTGRVLHKKCHSAVPNGLTCEPLVNLVGKGIEPFAFGADREQYVCATVTTVFSVYSTVTLFARFRG